MNNKPNKKIEFPEPFPTKKLTEAESYRLMELVHQEGRTINYFELSIDPVLSAPRQK